MGYAEWVLKGRKKREETLRMISKSSNSFLKNVEYMRFFSSYVTGTRSLCFFNKRIKSDGSIFSDDNKYVKLSKIGEGTYGKVFKAFHKDTPNKMVALKMVPVKNTESIPEFTMREVVLLGSLNHENVLKFIDVCRPSGGLRYRKNSYMTLVTEYCKHDLKQLINNPNVRFSLSEIKNILRQLFSAIEYIHGENIIHRDLKTTNILLTSGGVLKLADFGMAREIDVTYDKNNNCLTNKVVTLWYRAPELLLGEKIYGPAVDVWSAGCIMGEIFARHPILMGRSELEQLKFISRICGSITPAVWPDVVKLPMYNNIRLPQNMQNYMLEYLMSGIKDVNACKLMVKLLTLDPKKRFSAAQVLQDVFFKKDPLPSKVLPCFANFPNPSQLLKCWEKCHSMNDFGKQLMCDQVW